MTKRKKRTGSEPGQNGTRTITLPLAEPPESGYTTRHVDVQLSMEQAVNLRRLREGLHAQATKLKDGRYVQSTPDAVRYLLEQLGG